MIKKKFRLIYKKKNRKITKSIEEKKIEIKKSRLIEKKQNMYKKTYKKKIDKKE